MSSERALERKIERIRDRAAFARYERENLPVIIEGGARDWPAIARWSPAYLKRLLGDIELAFKKSASGVHPDFSLPTLGEMFATGRARFSDFIDAITAGPEAERAQKIFTGDERFLLRVREGVTTIDPELGPLLDDAIIPQLVPADRLYTVWAWFSGRGPRTSLHYDNNGCHNLNAQITGAKACTLIAPEHLDALALFEPGGKNPAHNCSPLDVQSVEVEKWTARIEAGDLLFIPAWWVHAFAHLGDFNSNLNFWWRPVQPIDNAIARRQATLGGSKPGY